MAAVVMPRVLPVPGNTCHYSQQPALIVCQFCQAVVTTNIFYDNGLVTWILAGGICLVGLWLGCCLIPFCVDATKDVEHQCPNCHNVVGKSRYI